MFFIATILLQRSQGIDSLFIMSELTQHTKTQGKNIVLQNDAVSAFYEKPNLSQYYDVLFVFFASVSLVSAVVSFIKKRVGIHFYFLFFCSVLFGFLSFWIQKNPPATIQDSVIVRSGPGENYLDLGALDAGMVVRVPFRQVHEGWVKIRFNQKGQEGYVPEKTLLLLEDESNKP